MSNDRVPRPRLNCQDELEIIQQHVNFDQSGRSDIPDWRTYPEIPTAEDLNPDWENPEHLKKIDSLIPNTWEQPWVDKNTYLETHYRLQREEAISMLRYSIKKYRQDPMMLDDDETWIYTKVYVQGYLMTRLGPMCRIQLSTERAGKNIRWTQTRRLPAGGLVALSTATDNFKTICMPAIIAEHTVRDGLDKTPPTIQIFWADMQDAVLDPALELVMVEARFGYFEAVRHCMVGLQHVANTPTPLDKYLVSLDKSDLDAEHVRENSEMNLTSLVHHLPDSANMTDDAIRKGLTKAKKSLVNCPVLKGIPDEVSKFTNLDNSQLSAVHRILTKELAIVQGPPGTGKTFTSVQALNVLLDSQMSHGSNTVIVAAQTNHAVDQLLMLLIKCGFNTLRLGGRTQSEEIKRYSMYNLRQRGNPPRSHPERDFKVFEEARKRNIVRIQDTVDGIFPKQVLDPHMLEAAGLITRQQRESLQFDDGWQSVNPVDDELDVVSQWLGDSRIEAPVMDSSNPEFDTEENDDMVDLDAEDYDIELDDCIADDDEVSGRVHGTWIPIKHGWTGANPRRFTEHDRILRRELEREDLWEVGKQYRGAIYQYWQRQLLSRQLAKFREALEANARLCKNLKANRWHRDLRCIRNASIEIIGCTTTGLCKYRGLLAALKPRIMLIEEAAETKEANILSALYPSLQQLVLVGDHQQLAPACDTPFLDEPPFFLKVSMFERLVKLQMPYTMLNMQRRMNPELRELLSPFYPGLKDHPVVMRPEARPPIPGMAVRSYFMHHTWTECMDDNFSKFNTLEAEMVVRFIDYLFMNGVKHSEVTVLTFYRGQRKKLLKEFRKLPHREAFKNVHTVDSYQGEENDIVVLSLVRSNGPHGPHRAGFLKDSNRAVVALSRARRGFYIFGNIINLENACEESRRLWGQVRDVFQQRNQFSRGGGIPITCQNHQRTTWMSDPEDWVNHHGGCGEPCTDKLECGHSCGRRCHWVGHERLICVMPCVKILRCGHPCKVLCGDTCACDCDDFTGAYAGDDSWDDKKLNSGATASLTQAVPFLGSVGQLGKLRGVRHRGRGDRGAPRHGVTSNSAEAPAIAANPAWNNFDPQLHDEQQRLLFFHANVPMGLFQRPTRANENEINTIRETFRQVTLDQIGARSIAGTFVSERRSNASSVNASSEDTDLIEFNDCPTDSEGSGDASLSHPVQTDSSEDDGNMLAHSTTRFKPTPFSELEEHYPQFRNAAVLRLESPSPPPVAVNHRTEYDVDKPEWERASTVVDTEDKSAHTNDPAPSPIENLIEL